MADKTKIEWTDATWNPITGCSVVSPGCTNCYAMRLAGTRLKHHPSRKGLTDMSKAGPVWNGEVRLNEGWLDQPLRWKKPRRIFVCAHGDLFHENVPDEWIDKVFAVMALAPQHTFQVLTKRSERMRDYLDGYASWLRVENLLDELKPSSLWNSNVLSAQSILGSAQPLPNVWLGVSAEDQKRWDERVVRDLNNTPAAVRWVSAEPLLDPIYADDIEGLDWVVCGGESGPGYRPMNPEWAQWMRDQCKGAGVAFYMKQMAGKGPIPEDLKVREYPHDQ